MWRVFYCRDCGEKAEVKYTKPALSFEQQADQLLNRGFQADRTRLIETLSRVSYYRLSAYWHPFKRPDESFAPGTTLDKVWRRYATSVPIIPGFGTGNWASGHSCRIERTSRSGMCP